MEEKRIQKFSVSRKSGCQDDQVDDLFETEWVNKFGFYIFPSSKKDWSQSRGRAKIISGCFSCPKSAGVRVTGAISLTDNIILYSPLFFPHIFFPIYSETPKVFF